LQSDELDSVPAEWWKDTLISGKLYGPLFSQPLFLFAFTPSPIQTVTALSLFSPYQIIAFLALQSVEHNNKVPGRA
jgi:hypothetical protein